MSTRKRKNKARTLPEVVYVQEYVDADMSAFLLADATALGAVNADCGHAVGGECVGVYKLVRVVKLTKDEKVIETEP